MPTRKGYTTITISTLLQERLKGMKDHPRQSYEEVIMKIIDSK